MHERPVVFSITAYLILHLQVHDILGIFIQLKIKKKKMDEACGTDLEMSAGRFEGNNLGNSINR
jgi:hypothetical protein